MGKELGKLGPAFSAAQDKPMTEKNEVMEITRFVRDVGGREKESVFSGASKTHDREKLGEGNHPICP